MWVSTIATLLVLMSLDLGARADQMRWVLVFFLWVKPDLHPSMIIHRRPRHFIKEPLAPRFHQGRLPMSAAITPTPTTGRPCNIFNRKLTFTETYMKPIKYTEIGQKDGMWLREVFPALVYLFCLVLPGSCLARFAYFSADLCTAFCQKGCMKLAAVHTEVK